MILAPAVAVGTSPAGAWELDKQWSENVADGVHYELRRYNLENGPAAFHVLQIDPYAGYSLSPVLPSSGLGELEPINEMASRTGAIAAVNGTFFDTESHLPVGFLRLNHRTVFGQHLNRALLGIDQFGSLHYDRIRPRVRLKFPAAGRSLEISRINYDRGWGQAVLYTPEHGHRTGTNRWGYELILTPDRQAELGGKYGLSKSWRVTGAAPENARIPKNGMVLSIHSSLGQKLGWLKQLPVGSEVDISTNLPQGWDSFPHVIGGGPLLLHGGSIVLNPDLESFSDAMSRPAARTAVATTRSGKTLIVVVSEDAGRDLAGVSWWQLALVLRDSLNAKHAIGFDGGASSAMWVNGDLTNYPNGDEPREVANILAVQPMGSGQ